MKPTKIQFYGKGNQKEHAFKHHRAGGKPDTPLHILQQRIIILEMAVIGQLGI